MNVTSCETCGRARDIEWSEDRDQLLAAVVKMQATLRPPRKGSVNNHRGYRYADLADIWEACREPLAEADLALLQVTGWGPRGLELVTTLAHTSGQWVRCRMPVLSVADPQAMGSALTYARKYSLMTIVGLAPDDDDDGEAARPKSAQRVTPRPPSAQRQHQRKDAPLQTAPAARQEPQEAPVEDLAKWQDRLQAAKHKEDLDRLRKEAAKAFPKGHPGREILREAIRARYTALDYAEAQANQRDPQWTGD